MSSDEADSKREFIKSFVNKTLEIGVPSLVDNLDSIDQRYVYKKDIAVGGLKIIKAYRDNITGRLVAQATLKNTTNENQISKLCQFC